MAVASPPDKIQSRTYLDSIWLSCSALVLTRFSDHMVNVKYADVRNKITLVKGEKY